MTRDQIAERVRQMRTPHPETGAFSTWQAIAAALGISLRLAHALGTWKGCKVENAQLRSSRRRARALRAWELRRTGMKWGEVAARLKLGGRANACNLGKLGRQIYEQRVAAGLL